jgi:dipeptidyl-peptidase-4
MIKRNGWMLVGALGACSMAAGQQPAVTAADYAHAEKFMPYATAPLVMNGAVRPTWISDDRFWYRTTTPAGTEFVLFDAAHNTRKVAFDHARVAAALSKETGTKYDPAKLPFLQIDYSDDGHNVSFDAESKHWTCDVDGKKCDSGGKAAARVGRGARIAVPSPDKKHEAFVKDYNLWVRDVASGKETALTTDGIKDFGYATDNAGWTSSERAIVAWSPDSQKIATFQQDQRGVGEMYLVDTKVGHPELQAWKYPLPGDAIVTTIQRVIVNLDGPKVVRLQVPADQHRSSLCDDVACRGGEWSDVDWSADSTKLAFVSTSRDHRKEELKIADAATGAVREVLTETVPTFFESGNGSVNWRYLATSNEGIWFSERSNWGHLYLYDMAAGKLKNAITSGDWNVTQVLRVDEKARQVYFLGVGREANRDPYFVHLYRANLDGTGLTLLTPEDANHDVSLSPTGLYLVDNVSKPDVPAKSLVRDASGKLTASLQNTDVSKLVEMGWKPPVPFTVKARDGVTDLSGLMYKPTRFDENKKYPIINHIYPGPQTGSIGSRNFAASRGDGQALAELGFVVVEIDGMGTPWRSKKFHEAYFGDMGDNTLPDQVAGMKELAKRYPWIDIDRAGIYGHSGGGYATADAMFRYPDFFKVGISEAGNHDNREYEDDWAEKWIGLLEKKADGTSNYDSQANQSLAKNLKGHLLLAHGTMDDNVPPYNTLLVVNELIKANKDFDLIMLPNRRHGFGNEPYMVRRRWDYFVKYLLGAEPPHEFELHPTAAGQ